MPKGYSADPILILDVARARTIKGLMHIDVDLPGGRRTLIVALPVAMKGLQLVGAAAKTAVVHTFRRAAGGAH